MPTSEIIPSIAADASCALSIPYSFSIAVMLSMSSAMRKSITCCGVVICTVSASIRANSLAASTSIPETDIAVSRDKRPLALASDARLISRSMSFGVFGWNDTSTVLKS